MSDWKNKKNLVRRCKLIMTRSCEHNLLICAKQIDLILELVLERLSLGA